MAETFTPVAGFNVYSGWRYGHWYKDGVAIQADLEYDPLGLLGGFSPGSLFGAADVGAWYDPSDLTSMFQLSNATVPAVVDSPVGYIADKSGKGNHAIQATAGARPILRSSGGAYWLEFDGADDRLVALSLAMPQPIDRISGLRQISWTDGDTIFGCVIGTYGALLQQNLASPTMRLYSGAGLFTSSISGDFPVGNDGILTERYSGVSSRVAINNTAYNVGDAGTIAPTGFAIGDFTIPSGASNIRFYGTTMISRALTDTEIQNTRDYLLAKMRPAAASYANYSFVFDAKNSIFKGTDGKLSLDPGSMPGYTYTRSGAKSEVQSYWTNLLLRSQEIDAYGTGIWVQAIGGTGVNPAVTANAGTAPDGTSTADRVVFDQGAGGGSIDFSVMAQGGTVSIGNPYTGSIWLKSNTGASQDITFYLDDNVNPKIGGSITVTTSWQRFALQMTPAATALYLVFGSHETFGGPASADILAWQAQLVQGTQPGPVIPTAGGAASSGGTIYPYAANVPGIAPGDGYWSRTAQTNIIWRSQEFDNAAWTIDTSNATIIPNAIVAPDGTLTADKAIANAAGSVRIYQVRPGSTTIGNVYTFSVFAKAAENSWVDLQTYDGVFLDAYFNLATGTIGNVTAGATASIQSVGNGWYRCSMTFTASNTGPYFQIFLVDGNGSAAVTIGKGIYLWQAQAVLGSQPGPIILTTSATATVGLDPMIVNWVPPASGTIYAEFIMPADINNNMIAASDGGGGGNALFYLPTATQMHTVNAYNPLPKMGLTLPVGSLVKVAVSWTPSGRIFCVNGTAAVSDALTIGTAITQMHIGHRDSSLPLNQLLQTINVRDVALTAAELQALTA